MLFAGWPALALRLSDFHADILADSAFAAWIAYRFRGGVF